MARIKTRQLDRWRGVFGLKRETQLVLQELCCSCALLGRWLAFAAVYQDGVVQGETRMPSYLIECNWDIKFNCKQSWMLPDG